MDLILGRQRAKHPADRLPLNLGGTGPRPGPRTVRIGGGSASFSAALTPVKGCWESAQDGAPVASPLLLPSRPQEPIKRCFNLQNGAFAGQKNCAAPGHAPRAPVKNCHRPGASRVLHRKNCQASPAQPLEPLHSCQGSPGAAAISRRNCQAAPARPAQPEKNCALGPAAAPQPLHHCRWAPSARPRRPVCWIEIKPTPKPDDGRICPLRPPSDRLPLALWRPRNTAPSDQLPINLNCWDYSEDSRLRPPIRESYLVPNRFSATADGEPIDIYNLTLRTDVASYCWQADFSVSPATFARLNMDGRARGQEALINLSINGLEWLLIAEDYSDTRQFIGLSYNISARSPSARLSADYAAGLTLSYDDPRAARQIADDALHYLDYRIGRWEAVDWAIPRYASGGKTPIAVIAELASAAGAFVASHRNAKRLDIKPIWPRPAWELGAPLITVPDSLIYSIRGQRRLAPQARAVRIIGDVEAALVYRSGSDQTPEAASQSSPLYTHGDVMRAAGIHALCESGDHKMQTVTLPLADKYQLPLAELGQIWSFDEAGQRWQGVVKGVEISVALENEAPVVKQTLSVDCYQGD